MNILKRIVAIAITAGFLAATGCSYRTCPTYTHNTQKQQHDTSQTAVASAETLAE